MKTAIDIACPRCLAAPGADCMPAGRTHQERFDAAERANDFAANVRGMFGAYFDAAEAKRIADKMNSDDEPAAWNGVLDERTQRGES